MSEIDEALEPTEVLQPDSQALANPQPIQLPASQPEADLQQYVPRTVQEKIATLLDTAGTFESTPEQRAIIFEPPADDEISIRPDGQVYLKAAWFTRRLRDAFGTKWAQVPIQEPKKEGNLWMQPFALFIDGRYQGSAYGECEYRPSNKTMSYGDVIEGTRSNGRVRLCKGMGMAVELWEGDFVENWKKRNAESYWNEEKGKNLWRKRLAPMKNCFRMVRSLGWSEEEAKKYFLAHCPYVNKDEGGEIKFKRVKSRKEYEMENWVLLETILQNMLEDPANVASNASNQPSETTTPPRTGSGAQEEQNASERQPAQPTEAERKAGATLQPSDFPLSGSVSDQIRFFGRYLGCTQQQVELWLELNYVCNCAKLYKQQQTDISNSLHDWYKDTDLKDRLKDDIKNALRVFYNGEGNRSPAHEMVHALAECSEQLVYEFLARLEVNHSAGGSGPRQVKLMTQGQIAGWKLALEEAKAEAVSAETKTESSHKIEEEGDSQTDLFGEGRVDIEP